MGFPEAPQEGNPEFALQQLSEFKKKFDPVLEGFLDNELEAAANIRSELIDVLKVGKEFVLNGGKRLRPAFLYFGYRAAGGQDEISILRSGCSVELIHAGALIHDDIIDNSDLRRGNPTVHKVLGNPLAILTGDTIAALAGKALNSFPAPDDRLRFAKQYFDQMCIEINFGQYLDVLAGSSDQVDVDWVMKIMRYKTAGYTVEKPLLIGAALGGASREVLEQLSRYALPLGTAFQLQDDILGMFGNAEKVGKPVDSDLKEGKKTVLIIKTREKLLQMGRSDDLRRLDSISGKPDLTSDDYLWVQSLIIESGSLEYCRDLAKALITSSKESLEGVNIDLDPKQYLLGIAEYMLAREY